MNHSQPQYPNPTTQRRVIVGVMMSLLAFVALMVVMSMSGCAEIRDGVARLIGAPTNAEISAVELKLDAAQQDQAKLAAQLEATKAAQESAKAAQANAQAQAKAAQQALAQVGAQLAQAEPGSAAYSALSSTFDGLKGQIAVLLGQADQAGQVVSKYGTQISHLSAAIKANAEVIGQANAKLAEFDQATTDAISGAGSGITALGQAASTLGVPGAGALATTVGGALTGILGLAFAGRKHGQAKAATAAADAATANAAATKTAALEIAGSIEAAKITNPDFSSALNQVKSLLSAYQGDAAKAIVDEAQGKAVAPPLTAAA